MLLGAFAACAGVSSRACAAATSILVREWCVSLAPCSWRGWAHASTRAALIYQHASQDRDQAIAAALGKAFKTARKAGTEKGSGTQRARKRRKAG